MFLDEACAGGAGDEATEEEENIPPTQEDMDMTPGKDTEEGEGMPSYIRRCRYASSGRYCS